MKVSELPYRRVTLEEVKAVMEDVIPRIKNAGSVEEILKAREDYLKCELEFSTNASLASMRYTINTVDPFYVAENEYYDEIGPAVGNYSVEYASALLDSPFRKELEEALSPVLFRSMEVQRKSMSNEIIEDMVEENKLVREYSDLMAAMEFEWKGEKLPRAMLMKYAKDPDRETRRECFEVLGRGLEEHKAELDSIFDRMVHVRDRMAKKMGYKNFVELGYYRMGRLCYDQEKVANFRANVLKDIVPVVARLRSENAKRLGIDKYMFYDDGVIMPGGDPRPFGKEEIFASAKKMYHAMGKESGDFIDLMLESSALEKSSVVLVVMPRKAVDREYVKRKERNIDTVEFVELRVTRKELGCKEPVLDPVLKNKERTVFRDLKRNYSVRSHDVLCRVTGLNCGGAAERTKT